MGKKVRINLSDLPLSDGDIQDLLRAIAPLQGDEEKWFYIPSGSELEALSKYAFTPPDFGEHSKERPHGVQTCPECKRGRLVQYFMHSNIGSGIEIGCKWGAPDCHYRLDITDYATW